MSNISLVPNWETSMRILLMVLQDGSDSGKDMARAELMNLAAQVDELNGKAEADVEVRYTIPLQFTEIQLRYMDRALAEAIELAEDQIRNRNIDTLPEDIRELPDKYLGCRRAISVALEDLS